MVMKKRWCVALVLLLLGSSVFSGGRRQDQESSAPAQPVTGKQDPMGRYDPPVSLTTVRTMNSTIQFDQNDPDKRSFEENRWVRTYRERLGINLGVKWVATDTNSETARWNAGIASGDIPDFAEVSENVYKQLVDADLIADMGNILAAYGSEEYLSLLTPSDYQQMTQGGELLGFPGSNMALSGTTLLFIRQDWLDKVGKKLPETIAEVIDIARAFRDAKLGGNDTIGILFSNNNSGGSRFVGGDGKWDGFFNAYGAYLNYWLERDGKLVYSSVLPEMREPLLALQAMYKEGLINRDFAVANNNVVQEYIASGKTGLLYASAYNVTQALNTMYDNDTSTRIVNLLPPPAVRGKFYPLQTNSPKTHRIFVSRRNPHPGAVVRMANLTLRSRYENFTYYMTDSNGFAYYKYLPWNGAVFAPVTMDLDRSDAIRYAMLNNGNEEKFTDSSWLNTYNRYKLAIDGKAPYWNLMLNGPGGSFSTLYDAYHEHKILVDAYNGLPTETQSLKGDLINDELNTAMFEVIMGADISLFERAAERWFSNGGAQITNEVNDWYRSVVK
jgi:putative aldouronate transport system substrate-binding protein